MAEPLHLPEDEAPYTEQVRLGDQTVELDSQSADAVRTAFEALAGQYGAALEEYRRQTLNSIGTNQPPPPQFQPQYQPDPLVPDPDLLLQNKGAWSDEFERGINSRIGQVRGEATQLVQGAVSAFQQELNRRDAVAQAKATHDAAMTEMLDRRGLADHTRVVQAIYNEQYEKLRHLPLELGLDKIGALAEEEIARIRAGDSWTMGQNGAQVSSRPPAQHLRSTQRRSRPVAPSAPADPGLQDPGGGLGMMGRIIRTRQAALLGGKAE